MHPASIIHHPESAAKSDTLFGGRTVPVAFNDGTVGEIKVRQLPLADYEKAFSLLQDELALTALICGQAGEWLVGVQASACPPLQSDTLKRELQPGVTPESYEALRTAAWEVNANGFFAWSARRSAREQQAQGQMLQALATLPPAAIEQIAQLGMVAVRKDTSPTSSPKRR